jgi:hypothetical protein
MFGQPNISLIIDRVIDTPRHSMNVHVKCRDSCFLVPARLAGMGKLGSGNESTRDYSSFNFCWGFSRVEYSSRLKGQ